MKTIVTTYLLLIVALACTSCRREKSPVEMNPPDPPGFFAQQIKSLESANVTNDVNVAMANSDLRFLVCVGFGGTIPGVPRWSEELYKKYGTRILDGTGDMIVSDGQRKFKAAAAAYAEAYNKLLWSRTEGQE